MANASGEFVMGGVKGRIDSDTEENELTVIKPSVRRALEIRQEKKWLKHQLEDTFSEGLTDLEDLGW